MHIYSEINYGNIYSEINYGNIYSEINYGYISIKKAEEDQRKFKSSLSEIFILEIL